MLSSTLTDGLEPRWWTYLRLTVQLLPGVVLWSAATVLFVPKLQQLWTDAGGPISDVRWVMNGLMFLVRHGALMAIGILGLLMVLEFQPARWGRYRRAASSAAVFVLNSAMLFGLWLMCMGAVMVAPALSRR